MKQTFSEGRCSGGPHMRLSRQTELVGVSLASAIAQHPVGLIPSKVVIPPGEGYILIGYMDCVDIVI